MLILVLDVVSRGGRARVGTGRVGTGRVGTGRVGTGTAILVVLDLASHRGWHFFNGQNVNHDSEALIS